MSDTFVLPGLRDRILSGAWIARVPRLVTPANVRTVATATVAAAAIAGAMTWVQSAYLSGAPAAKSEAAFQPPSQHIEQPPPASSTYAKTNELVDQLAGLRSDPSLHFETSTAWQPAGGLSILTTTSAFPNERLAALPMPAPIVAMPTAPQTVTAEIDDVPLPRAHPGTVAAVPVRPMNAAPAVVATAPDATVESKPSSSGFFGMLKRFFTPQDKQNATAVLASNPRTAIYDISAHIVYLPNGDTLEAHSGLGEWLDDPSSFNRKDRGVTPPATYKISMREKLFHGVQALRLTPVGEAQMYGRDGMLAHSYMLGANGQSNGCVSFKDYQKFLQAFSSGQVDQLIVVPKLTSTTAYAQAS